VHDLTNGAYVRQAYTVAGNGMMTVTKPADAKPVNFYESGTLSQEGVR